MSSPKIVLIFGAGSNIGSGVAQSFKSAGYKVALVSRSVPDGEFNADGFLTLKADLGDKTTVPRIFAAVKEKLGGPPSTVVYNPAYVSLPTDPNNPLSSSTEEFEYGMALMNTTPFVAAKEAIAGFETLPANVPKAFIYTGNGLAAFIHPAAFMLTLGTGKSAASFWMGFASANFKEKGYKFYFADERTSNGMGIEDDADLSGKGHGEFYLKLAEEDNKDVPWHATFISGKGYTHFPGMARI